jgi:ClpP class serine protease
VAKGRGIRVAKVQKDFGQGAQMTAEASLAAGVVDGILSFEEVVAKMAKGWRPSAPKAEEEAAPIVAEAPAPEVTAAEPVPVMDADLWAVRWGL